MSNLNKYIENINEEIESSDNKGQMYEKLIFAGFLYLKNKSKKNNPAPLKAIDNRVKIIREKLKNLREAQKSKLEDKETKVKEIFSEIKIFVLENKKKLNIDINERDTKKIFLASLRQYIRNHDTETMLRRIKKYDEETKNKNIVNNQKNKYANALQICKNFLSDRQISETDITDVEHIGDKQHRISKYWIELYPTNKDSIELEQSSSKQKKTGTTTSIGKTDIVLIVKNNKTYKLSLKHVNSQLASPTYVDIYTLIMHGINVFLKNISINKLVDDKGKNIKIDDSMQTLVGNILKKIEDNRRKYIDKLKKEIVITDKKSNEYATNVSASILLELFIKELGKELGNNIQKNDFVKSIKKLQKNKLDKDLIKNIAKQFNSLFSDKDDIKRINIKKHKIAFNITDEIKNDVNQLLTIFKKEELLRSRLYRLKLEGNEYEKTFEAIKRLLTGRDDAAPSKEKEYDIIFQLKDSEEEAEKQFEVFIEKNKILNLIEIEKKQKDKFKQVIKKEIIKEAITGQYKFEGKKNFLTKNVFVANYIFEFNSYKNDYYKIIPIDSETNLNSFVNKIFSECKFDFSIKGSSSQSYISLRIKSTLQEIIQKIKKSTNELIQRSNDIVNINNSFDEFNYEYDIYDENFVTNLTNKLKNNVLDIFNKFKIKTLNIAIFIKNKAKSILNLLGLKVQIDKSSKLPSWIVNKL